jgi:hypothetical protein
MSLPCRRFALVSGMAFAFWVQPASSVRADALQTELAKMAREIDSVRKQQEQPDLAIGEFVGPSYPQTSSGPEIQRILREELLKLNVDIKKRASLEVQGAYRNIFDNETRRETIKITARVVSASTGDAVREIPARVLRDNETVVRFTNPSFHISGSADDETINRSIRDAIEHPSVFTQGSRVQSDAGSPFSVELLVLPRSTSASGKLSAQTLLRQARARRAKAEEGFAFVPLGYGERFLLRINNDSDHEAAATIRIDGLSVFQFATEKNPLTGRPYTHKIVKPGKSRIIEGWFRTTKSADSFVTTDYGKGAASQVLRSPAKIGTITVTFAPCLDGTGPAQQASRPPRPATSKGVKGFPKKDAKGQPGSAPKEGPPKRSLEVGFGEPVGTNSKPVTRTIGGIEDVVSIRYEK